MPQKLLHTPRAKFRLFLNVTSCNTFLSNADRARVQVLFVISIVAMKYLLKA